MDGASKFVRGDAMAGILILLINIFGGLQWACCSMISQPPGSELPILLAVGDALVAQIPGLLISVAATMVVSRVGKEHDIGKADRGPDVCLPRVLGITAGIMAFLGIIPNMPHLFLSIAALLGYGAWLLSQKPDPATQEAPAAPATTTARQAGTTCNLSTNWAWSSATD